MISVHHDRKHTQTDSLNPGVLDLGFFEGDTVAGIGFLEVVDILLRIDCVFLVHYERRTTAAAGGNGLKKGGEGGGVETRGGERKGRSELAGGKEDKEQKEGTQGVL